MPATRLPVQGHTLHLAERENHEVPKPFHCNLDGEVGRQGYWKGEPDRIVGFVSTVDSTEIVVDWDEWIEDGAPHEAVIGKYAVGMALEGEMWTFTQAVEEVTDLSEPPAVM